MRVTEGFYPFLLGDFGTFSLKSPKLTPQKNGISRGKYCFPLRRNTKIDPKIIFSPLRNTLIAE
jgi:hypothetical protein